VYRRRHSRYERRRKDRGRLLQWSRHWRVSTYTRYTCRSKVHVTQTVNCSQENDPGKSAICMQTGGSVSSFFSRSFCYTQYNKLNMNWSLSQCKYHIITVSSLRRVFYHWCTQVASHSINQSISEFIQRRGTMFLMRYSVVLILLFSLSYPAFCLASFLWISNNHPENLVL